jgi:hypothetical protein
VPDPRDEAIVDLRSMIESGRRCAGEIEAILRTHQVVLESLQRGASVDDALARGIGAPPDLTCMAEEFEAALRRCRESLMSAHISSGAPAKSVSETWELSRPPDQSDGHRSED